MKIVQYILSALLIGVIIINLTQRNRLSHGERKRFATLYLAGLTLILYLTVLLINRFRATPLLLLVSAAAVAVVILWQKKHFPYTLRCISCRGRLTLKRLLYYDSNVCETCDASEET